MVFVMQLKNGKIVKKKTVGHFCFKTLQSSWTTLLRCMVSSTICFVIERMVF